MAITLTKKISSNKLLMKSSAIVLGFLWWSEVTIVRKQKSIKTISTLYTKNNMLNTHNLFLPESMDMLHYTMSMKNHTIDTKKIQEQKNDESYES